MSSNTHFNKPFLNKPCQALLLAFVCSTVSVATQASDNDLPAALLETTGVSSHLVSVSDGIYADALPRYAQCFTDKNTVMSESDKQEFKTLLEQHFGGTVTVPRAIDSINSAMIVSDQEAVQAFFESPIGMRIVAAEFASKDYDEHTFNKLMDKHLKSSAWDSERKALIASVYDSTQAARFVSILNGEIMAASTLSAHCDTDAESLDKLQPHLETLRSESRFVEPIMRGQLLPLVATVFRNIPNSDLTAYVEFAQSELGVKFFDALLSSTQSSLSEGVTGLRLSLQK